jgi:zinc transporter 1/2/3
MEAETQDDFWGLNRDAAKVISLLFLGIGSFIVGLLPAAISRRNLRSHPLALSGMLCFGGGVLLATCLVHMLPEVIRAFIDY